MASPTLLVSAFPFTSPGFPLFDNDDCMTNTRGKGGRRKQEHTRSREGSVLLHTVWEEYTSYPATFFLTIQRAHPPCLRLFFLSTYLPTYLPYLTYQPYLPTTPYLIYVYFITIIQLGHGVVIIEARFGEQEILVSGRVVFAVF
ncbi:hypothetical protein F5X99DRAFT_208934 [Biscogniauxia marginata]|nr:hypothetical protein F5X99DRAFT_208934 [Biscogniauxia marginata]